MFALVLQVSLMMSAAPALTPDGASSLPIIENHPELAAAASMAGQQGDEDSGAKAKMSGETSRPCRDNDDMARMFAEDQAARQSSDADWDAISAADARRRAAVQSLMEAGLLCTGNDLYFAAFIFQHGGQPEDYLKAHALAVVAASKGRRGASWIAAATLDRYLQSIGQKQIYGTQFLFPDDSTVSQEPFDRTLLPDSIRLLAGVPGLADQEQQRVRIEEDIRHPDTR